jgi:predicted transcriptional regulator of viral defense system
MSRKRSIAPNSQAKKALALFAQTPLLRARDLAAVGVARETLRRLVAAGELERPSRGLYWRKGAEISGDVSLAEVARRTPHAVISLLSALRFHGLTTQLPQDVWIYLDRKARPPAHPPVRLRVLRVSGDGLTDGVERHTIDGVPVAITGVSRTLVDCFKRRNDVGLDVALEALRDARRLKTFRLDEVWRIAERRRALTCMRPYLEVLGHGS